MAGKQQETNEDLAIPSIFVHFFNDQMHRNYKLQSKFASSELAVLVSLPVKMAYLLTDGHLLIPTIDLAESPALIRSLPALDPLLAEGSILFCGSAVDPLDFLRHKQRHFSSLRLYPQYFEGSLGPSLYDTHANWVRRIRSTTRDIMSRWKLDIEQADSTGMEIIPGSPVGNLLVEAYAYLLDDLSPSRYLAGLYEIPGKLDGEAFLWDLVSRRRMVPIPEASAAHFPIRLLLAQQWLLSHLDEYQALLLIDFPKLGLLDCGLNLGGGRGRVISYRVAARILEGLGLLQPLKDATIQDLISLKALSVFTLFKRSVWWPRISGRPAMKVGDVLALMAESTQVSRSSRDSWNGDVARTSAAFDYIRTSIDQLMLDYARFSVGRTRELNLSISHVPSLTIRTGNITASEKVITITADKPQERSSSQIHIQTGNIIASPAAINVNSRIREIALGVDRLQNISQADRSTLGENLRSLEALLAEESALRSEERRAILADLQVVVESAPKSNTRKGRDRIHGALANMSEIAAKAGPAAAGLAAVIESIRQVVSG